VTKDKTMRIMLTRDGGLPSGNYPSSELVEYVRADLAPEPSEMAEVLRDAVIEECIQVLRDKVEIYKSPQFAYPSGCIHSVITTRMHIDALAAMKGNQ